MRVLLALLLIAIASPVAAAPIDDLFLWALSANDRSASKGGGMTLATLNPAPDPALGTSFLDDPLQPEPAGDPDRRPQIPDRGIPLGDPAPGTRDSDASSPIPEPAAALFFVAGAYLVARRVRAARR